MMPKINSKKGRNIQGGFIALIAVVLLSMTALLFSFVTMGSAFSYADTVSKRELRIQANMNADACLDTATLMTAKDYFLIGTSTLSEFGCTVQSTNDFAGNVTLNISVKFAEIVLWRKRVVKMTDSAFTVVSDVGW